MSSPAPPLFPIFHTPLYLLHDPPTEVLSGRPVPYIESPTRYHRVLEALLPADNSGGRFEEHKLDWERDDVVTPELLAAVRAVHGEEYLAFLREIYDEWVAEGGSKDAALPETFLRQDLLLDPAQDGEELSKGSAIAQIGRFSFDLSAPVTADTYISALASARLALCTLTHLISTPSLQGAFALCADFQSQVQAVAAGGGKGRVAILDNDYHHGNGTSKVFWDDPRVLYVSLHVAKDYPWYTGAAAEVGGPSARGTNVNYPLPLGTGNGEYLTTLKKAVEKVREWRAELLIVSLGVDTYIDDPLTDFRITLEAFPMMGRSIGAAETDKMLFCSP
ncbi:hypothetical protein JCM6882_004384 [Rhodosporidiobolus microsporus]